LNLGGEAGEGRKTMKRAIVAVAIACGAGIVAMAQKPADNAPGTGPYIRFGLVKAGDTAPTSTVGDDLAPGAPVAVRFTARQSLCESTIGGPFEKLPPPPADARYLMRLSAELLGEKDGTYSVRLTSQRLRAAGAPDPEPPLEQTVSLRDGDRVVVDMVREAAPGCAIPAVTIEARFFVRQDPALAQAVYLADVWFVHKDDTGREWNQHLSTNVNGAVDVPLVFKDVTFPLPKIDPAQDEFTAFVRVTGTLRARARRDGLVDIDLTTRRGAGLLLPSMPPGADGSSTRKSITVRLDETTAIELPQPSSGYVETAMRIGEKMPGTGVIGARPGGTEGQTLQPKMSIRDGRFIFNTGAFFKDHVTRLLIRLRAPAPSPPGHPPQN
jgi:hypothetical protein